MAALGLGAGIEIMQVAEQVAGRVAHLAVDIGQLLHDPRPQRHIGGVIHRAHPEAQHIGAVGGLLLLVLAALHQHRRIDDVAKRFAHLAALLIEHEAMGEHAAIRRPAGHGHGGEQAALEPAAVLVGALQVEVGREVEGGVARRNRPSESANTCRRSTGTDGSDGRFTISPSRSCASPQRPVACCRAGGGAPRFRWALQAPQHPCPGGAGVEPHVHGVGALAPLVGLVGPGGRQQTGLVALPPHVGAVLGDQGLDVGEGVGIEQHLAAVAVIKDRDRHAPGALARDAPVAPVAHHRLDPVAAALRHPDHRGDGREGLVAEALHRGEPLLGGAEDRGLLGAPVVGVAVGVALLRQQGAGVAQGRQDGGVSVLQHVEPGEGAGFGGEGAALIHRAENRQAVLSAGIEVVDAVARGGVHQAGAGFGGHVVAAHQYRRGAIQQGMAVLDPLQRLALHAEQGFEGALQGGAQAVHERFGHHQIAGGVGGGGTIAADGVVELAIDGDGQVGGQGPGGGGPDRHEQLLAVVLVGGTLDAMGPQLAGQGGGQLHHRKGHVGAGGGVAVGVFQFGLGQGGAGARAPVHRLEAPVDVACHHHLAEHTDLGGLVGLVEGEVGLVPVGPDAPAAETAALALHLLDGVGVGAAAQAEGGELLAFVAGEPLQHLQLDRQAVAVPARHEARPLAVEEGVLVDDVLEHLVEGVAHVQGAVGVGRAVMQGEHRARTVWVEPFTAEPFIEPLFSPEGLDLGLPHPGVGPHLERRLQQVEGVLVGGRAGGHNGGMREGGIISSRRAEPGAGVRRVPPVGPVGIALLGPWAPILGSPGSCCRGPAVVVRLRIPARGRAMATRRGPPPGRAKRTPVREPQGRRLVPRRRPRAQNRSWRRPGCLGLLRRRHRPGPLGRWPLRRHRSGIQPGSPAAPSVCPCVSPHSWLAPRPPGHRTPQGAARSPR